MKHYLLKISYDGASFNGWQRLKNNPNTIQQIIEDVLKTHISGSGRTDAGVNAKSQYADFYSAPIQNFNNFINDINEKLPKTIRINSIKEVSNSFHSRKSAISKTYSYYISLNAKLDVFEHRHCYNLLDVPISYNINDANNNESDIIKLDFNEMKKAAAYLTGTYDYSAFTSDKTPNKSHIRTIYSIDFDTKKTVSGKEILIISITGNGFLYNMVRIIAGTIIFCGLGKINANEIPNILEQKIRKYAGPTLPANALFLMDVRY